MNRLIAYLGLLAVLCGAGAAAVAADPPQPLPGAEDFPWYDAEKDQLRRLDVQPPAQLQNRDSRWTPPRVPSGGGLPFWLRDFLEIVGWVLVSLLVLALLYGLIRFLLNRDLAPDDLGEETGDAADEPEPQPRVEALPFPLAQAKGDLLAMARYYYEQADYNQAVIYLYSYFLTQLDRRQVIHLTRGKTNRQYLREVRTRPFFFELLQHTMLAFEDVFFGGRSLERARFESCWERVQEFQQQLERASP